MTTDYGSRDPLPDGIDSLTRSRVPALEFSICTLVTDAAQYQRMHASFLSNGFEEAIAEFIVADNRAANIADGYDGLRRLIASSCGRYVICCHQDIEIAEQVDVLRTRLAQLDDIDPNWSVCGNAGLDEEGRFFLSLRDDINKANVVGGLPARVDVLDENFLLIRRETLVAPSRDLSGFHHYGVDLCLQAEIRGWSCYVIDYQMVHHGRGHVDDRYFDSADALEEKYARIFRARRIRTLFRAVHIDGSRLMRPFVRLRAAARREKWRRRRDA